jgi:FMN phosphatase YigB (HAD superfamily)
MKSLSEYVCESIKPLAKGVKGLVVFDIDDTLLKVKASNIRIYKKDPNTKKIIPLTTSQFAKDPDAAMHRDWFDYSDFYDPKKVYDSIIEGTPLIKNLKIMDSYVRAGYDFCFLTARGCEDVVKKALGDFLEYKDDNGEMQKLGKIFKKTLSHAINDEYKDYPGKSDAEKKANVLRDLCQKYDKVVFVDDDTKNIQSARGLQIDNLKVIQAWKD